MDWSLARKSFRNFKLWASWLVAGLTLFLFWRTFLAKDVDHFVAPNGRYQIIMVTPNQFDRLTLFHRTNSLYLVDLATGDKKLVATGEAGTGLTDGDEAIGIIWNQQSTEFLYYGVGELLIPWWEVYQLKGPKSGDWSRSPSPAWVVPALKNRVRAKPPEAVEAEEYIIKSLQLAKDAH